MSNSLQVNETKRRSHSNTVSGGRPPALDIEISRPTFVRRNSEGSPRLPPPICVSEPTPIEPSNNFNFFYDKSSSRGNSRPHSPNSDSSSPPPPGPLLQSSSTAPISTLLDSPKNNKSKSRSRASSITSNLINDIKESTTMQHLASKIKSRHSSEETERNSFEAVSSAAASVSSSSVLANTKRNQDFHALFRSVPEDDSLIEDFGCALQKEILLQGRIYVSENYLCFNSNIFGWVTNLVIAFADIIDIEKKSTAYFIPNAIQITTDGAKHFFASFLSRDQAHDLMVDLWRVARPDLIPRKEGESIECADEASPSSEEDSDSYYDSDTEDSFSDSSSANSEIIAKDSDRESPTSVNRARQESLASLQGTKVTKNLNAAARRRAMSEVPKSSFQIDNKSSNDNTSQKPGSPQTGKTSNVSSNKPVEKPQLYDNTDCDCSSDHFPTIVMDQVYNGTLESLYNLMFHSGFMKKFLLENQKSTELTIGDWKKGEGDIELTRESSYIKQLNGSIGPKSTKCMITEEVLHKDFDKFITVMTTTSTPDVPSGGSFSCKTRTCFTWSGKGKVRILVTVLVDFTKSSWLKSTIEKASIDGQQTYYKELDIALRAYLKENGNGNIPSSRHEGKRKKKGKKPRQQQSVSDHEMEQLKEEQVDAVHRVLGALSNKLADAITGLIDLVASPNSSHLTLLCLVVMVCINIFIAKKMAFVEQQLNSLNHASDYMEEAESAVIQHAPVTNQPYHREYNRQEENDLWDWLGRIDPDKSSPVKERVMQPVSNPAEQEIVWDSAIQSSKAAKDKLDRHMAELSQMIQKAESNLEQVTNAVKEQRQKIKQEK